MKYDVALQLVLAAASQHVLEHPKRLLTVSILGYGPVPVENIKKAIKKVREETKRTVDQVNAEMQAIFKAHNVNAGRGEEMFWEAVDEVRKVNKPAARKLQALAVEWDSLQQ